MSFKKTLIAAVIVATPALASAASDISFNPSYFDLYYLPSAKIKASTDFGLGTVTAKDEGDGYGVKTHIGLGQNFFLAGEYQANDYSPEQNDNEEFERDLNIYRFGAGMFIPETPFFVEGEYIGIDIGGNDSTNADEDEDRNGYGVHAGVSSTFGERVTLNAKVGYVDVDDLDGFEYLVGGAFNFTQHLGVFADYRGSDLKGSNDNKLELNEFRTGVRFAF